MAKGSGPGTSLGQLALRVSFGAFMLVHGLPKLQGFAEMADGFPDPLGIGSRFSLIAAIAAELGCSVLLILGLGTRLAALPLAFTMFVAFVVVHGSDPWQKKELAAVYFVAYVVIFLLGPGKFSLDHLFWGGGKEEYELD